MRLRAHVFPPPLYPPTHTAACLHTHSKQPVKETADKQSALWGSLILAYCKHNKVRGCVCMSLCVCEGLPDMGWGL